MKEVYIISAVRTPMGSFGGSLSTVPAPQLRLQLLLKAQLPKQELIKI
jgi:acetyl-CoA acetyltransferase